MAIDGFETSLLTETHRLHETSIYALLLLLSVLCFFWIDLQAFLSRRAYIYILFRDLTHLSISPSYLDRQPQSFEDKPAELESGPWAFFLISRLNTVALRLTIERIIALPRTDLVTRILAVTCCSGPSGAVDELC